MFETSRSTRILNDSKTIALHHTRKFPARKVFVFKNFFKLEDDFPAIAIVVEFTETIRLCPKWELVDFYIDEGGSPPNMESAPEWCRLLDDCMEGKVDLIITQKVSNVSRKNHEVTIVPDFWLSKSRQSGFTLFPKISSLWPPAI